MQDNTWISHSTSWPVGLCLPIGRFFFNGWRRTTTDSWCFSNSLVCLGFEVLPEYVNLGQSQREGIQNVYEPCLPYPRRVTEAGLRIPSEEEYHVDGVSCCHSVKRQKGNNGLSHSSWVLGARAASKNDSRSGKSIGFRNIQLVQSGAKVCGPFIKRKK